MRIVWRESPGSGWPKDQRPSLSFRGAAAFAAVAACILLTLLIAAAVLAERGAPVPMHWRALMLIAGVVGLGASAGLALLAVRARLNAENLERRLARFRRRLARLEGQNQAKSELIAALSHEMRTPLNAIIGFSSLLTLPLFRGSAKGAERALEYAEDIQASGEHLLGVVNAMLDLSRIETGHMPLVEESVAIDKLVDDAVRLVELDSREAGLRLEVELAKSLPAIFVDAGLIRQILINLLTNAIKFTEPGGTVRLTARQRKGRQVELIVSDTGAGMPADQLARALKPFEQLGGAVAERGRGAGLGLSLAKAFADLHGATLNIESTVGEGTRVTLRLPAARSLGVEAQQAELGA